MSYEDFIEGIKPLPPEKDQDLKYDVVDGIFKNLCRSAESNWLSYNRKGDNNVTFEDVFDELKEKWEADTEMKFGMKTEGKEFTITGFSNKSIYFKKASGREGHTLSINTLRDIYYKKRATWGNGVGIYYPGIIEKLEYAVPIYKENPSEPNNYVIIIDEINRGNVSQIFGELITLLEDDKRIGAKEALKITLPYSGDQFAVPPNLSVVGTMNTADRSVEALDTALRRRFSFVPMAPEPEELKKQAGQVNLQTLLRTLNNRLIILKDADHTIGHALLWEVDSIEKLKAAFENKILPLLQEYFYNDYEKLGLVLGDAFFQLPHKRVGGNEFALFSGSSGLSGQYKNKYIYKLKNAKDLEEADFLTLTQAPAINEDQ
ncbi:MAG: AAA family ATPase [Saprospiraceae bacterium]|nr:AAA family ATPase [Candidatus Vicinibacter affinis]MBK8642220.1 AAA family ATPase [Candidatus Vicinibacter affinis]